MSRLAAGLVALATLLTPAVAQAAPIPGATYDGTTDNGSPFSFRVTPDGQSVTDVLGSVSVFCSQGEGFQIVALASTYLFPAPGNTIGGEDEDGFPRLTLNGTFSGSDASGTLNTNHAYTSGGALVVCGTERTWTARTASAAPGGGSGGSGGGAGGATGGTGGTGGGGAATPTPTTPSAGAAAIKLSFPRGVKLLPSLSNGFVVGAGVSQAASLTGTATLSAADAKRYGLGKKAKVIARAKVQNADADSGLEFVPSRSVAKKLRKAKKLTLTIDAVATTPAGATSRATKKVTLKR